MLSFILDLLAPTKCIACGMQGPDVCRTCRASLRPAKKQSFEWITSLWDYHDHRAELIIRHLKNTPNRRLALSIAKAWKHALPDSAPKILVPIPLGRDRMRERGYNQALILAQALSSQTNDPVRTILRKQKQTLKQGTVSSRAKRLLNMKNAFSITASHSIKGRDVLIIDDVTTTGATLSEARTVLLNHGAKSVSALTIAH